MRLPPQMRNKMTSCSTIKMKDYPENSWGGFPTPPAVVVMAEEYHTRCEPNNPLLETKRRRSHSLDEPDAAFLPSHKDYSSHTGILLFAFICALVMPNASRHPRMAGMRPMAT